MRHFDASSPNQDVHVDVREIPTRLPAHGRMSERVLAIMALIGALIGGMGLILLSGFDTGRYPTLHRTFLAVFMFGVVLSALFTMAQVSTRSLLAQSRRIFLAPTDDLAQQFALLARSHRNRDPDDYKLARISAILKGVAVLVLVSLAIAFTTVLWRVQKGSTRGYDIAGESISYSLWSMLASNLC